MEDNIYEYVMQLEEAVEQLLMTIDELRVSAQYWKNKYYSVNRSELFSDELIVTELLNPTKIVVIEDE